MKVAIQGVEASFHAVAARKYFENIEFQNVECNSFPTLFETLMSKKCDYALMAIENAIAGSILPNYALMEKNKIVIIGEVYIKIEMCLMALPGVKLEEIRFIRSHPMALLQCQNFIQTLGNVVVLECNDTAESAKDIKEKNLSHDAAIASRLAAEVFGLNILKAGIETDHSNFTRFLVLARKDEAQNNLKANKSSICFEVSDRPGSLAKALNIFHKYQVNLTKIQSLPVLGRPYQYSFHVDLEWDEFKQYEDAIKEIGALISELKEFGHYQRGKKVKL